MPSCLRNLALATAALLPLGIGFAVAGPNGGTVVGGGATIGGQGTSNVTINQSTPRAIINWHTFNIGTGETTTFNQPDSSSVALNRVTGGLGPSNIDGTLNANGRVFIVNRDGILFGPGAVINTSGFLATTNDISNADFMAGRYNFNIPGRPDASIVNHGTITAHNAGFAALVAPGVRNTGTITATLGTVGLASGNSFTLDFYGDRLITLAVGDSIGTTVRDVETGKPLSSLVENTGRLSANGGRVQLTAAAARQVVDSVINTSGVVEANRIGTRGGTIVLSAATAATKGAGAPKQTVRVSGTLSASGKRKGETAGKVVVTGEDIRVTGARVDVSGSAGGGTALIGGDWGGGNPNASLVSHPRARLENGKVATAATVTIDSATVINASATDSGSGGKVVVWSDQSTSFAGLIEARGGPNGGNGGFVEVSGKQHLDFNGSVDLRAPIGTAGTLLLDPADYFIDAKEADRIERALETANVVITTQLGEGEGNGDIWVQSNINWATALSLTLSAFHDINISSGVTITNTYAGANPSTLLTLRADNTGRGQGTVNFGGGGFQCGECSPSGVNFSGSTGAVAIYYNPIEGDYSNPRNYSNNVSGQFTAYMLVNGPEDLNRINNLSAEFPDVLRGTYALGRNFSVSEYGSFFAPGTQFNGILDGHGGLSIDGASINYSISNLSTTLFPFIGPKGEVRNLDLTEVHIAATDNNKFLGALAGVNQGTVTNVTASGRISGGDYNGIIAGGLIGQNEGHVAQSHAEVNVSIGNGAGQGGGWNYAGGLVGYNYAGIANSSAGDGSTKVSGGHNSFVGGLVGRNDGTINTGGVSAAVRGTSDGSSGTAVGGLVGANAGSIANSFARGSVSGTGNAGSTIILGGLVGLNGLADNGTATAVIANSFAEGIVTATGGGQIGGLVGGNFARIEASRATGAVSNGSSGATGGLVGFNDFLGTITGSHATGAVSGGHIAGGLVGDNSGAVTASYATGAVTVSSSGLADLAAGGLVGENTGTIANSYATGAVTSTGGDIIFLGGLAGSNSGSITSSHATGNVTANSADTFVVVSVGGLVGGNEGKISNSQAGGNVSANGAFAFAGGFVGLNFAGQITESSASGAVTGGGDSFAGGFAGANFVGLISQSSATGPVTSGDNSFVGGLVALNVGEINQSAASGEVTGGANGTVGGLVAGNVGIPDFGSVVGASLPQFTLFQPGVISQSYATGAVTGGANSTVGGLVGMNGGAFSLPELPTIAACNACLGLQNASASAELGSIASSYATGAVNGGLDSTIGGLVGANSGSIIDSHASGAVANRSDPDGPAFAGGLVGENFGSVATSHAVGPVGTLNPVNTSYATYGGLVGFNYAGGTISQSFATGNVAGNNSAGNGTVDAGGLVGANAGTITTSHAEGSVNVVAGFLPFVGGLVGWNQAEATVSGSEASGIVVVSSVGADAIAGGLVGVNDGTLAHVSVLTRGSVSGDGGSLLGGLVGENTGAISHAQSAAVVSGTGQFATLGGLVAINDGTITQSGATGAVVGGAFSFIGGLVGNNLGTITESTALGAVTGGNSSLSAVSRDGILAARSRRARHEAPSPVVTGASLEAW